MGIFRLFIILIMLHKLKFKRKKEIFNIVQTLYIYKALSSYLNGQVLGKAQDLFFKERKMQPYGGWGFFQNPHPTLFLRFKQ